MADEEKAEPRLLAEVEIDVGRFHALLRDGRRLTSDEAPDLVRVISEGDAPERAEARLGTPDSARMFVIPESLTEVAVVGVGAHLDVLSLEVRRCMSIVVARGDGPSTDRLNALCEPGSVRLRIVEGPQAETDFGR